MKLQGVKAGATLASLVLLAVGGCATGQSMMKPADAIAARQKLMKEQSATMKSITAKVKAGQAQDIGPEAQKLVETSKQIPALFPEGSLDPKTSRAKPEIWQKWPDFTADAKALEAKATQLAATSRAGNAQATAAAVADLGKTTCGACHDAFRGPQIKK